MMQKNSKVIIILVLIVITSLSCSSSGLRETSQVSISKRDLPDFWGTRVITPENAGQMDELYSTESPYGFRIEPSTYLAWFPDGKRLMIDDTIYDLNFRSDDTLEDIKKGDFELSPDGKIFATLDHVVYNYDITNIRLYDVDTGNILKSLITNKHYSFLFFMPDSVRLVCVGGVSIDVWDIEREEIINSLSDYKRTISSVDGELLLGRSRQYRVSNDGKTLVNIYETWTEQVKFKSWFLLFWDIETGEVTKFLDLNTTFDSRYIFEKFILRLSADGKKLGLYDSNGKIYIQDYATFDLTKYFDIGSDINDFSFSPDNRLIATAGGTDYTVRLFDVETGVELTKLIGHTNEVYKVLFSLDGHTLYSFAGDGIRIWGIP